MRSQTDDLDGVPGLGPARRAALAAVGLTTRAALHSISLEQLISVSGMTRAQATAAIAAIAAIRTECEPLGPPGGSTEDAPQDEAYPKAAIDDPTPPDDPKPTGPTLADDDQSAEIAARASLDRAVVRLKGGLADLTREERAPEVDRSVARLAGVLDTLMDGAAPSLPPKTARAIAVRLDRTTARIEKALAKDEPLSQKRTGRLIERLRKERKRLKAALRAAPDKPYNEKEAPNRADVERP